MSADPVSYVQPMAVTAVLGLALAILQARRRRTVPDAPAAGVVAFGLPLITGHLLLNGLNYFFPPSAGIDWMVFATVAWMMVMGAVRGVGLLLPPGTPATVSGRSWWRRCCPMHGGLTTVSLLLAGVTVFLCQWRLPWLFGPDESPELRSGLTTGLVAGGILFCAGQVALARLLPAGGFWLCQLAICIPDALSAGLQSGPDWLAALHWIPAVLAAVSLVPVAADSDVRVTGTVAVWAGVAAGLPFLWSAVSRTPATPPEIPLTLSLLPAAAAMFLTILRRWVHPVGLSLAGAALLLAGTAQLLRSVSPSSITDGNVLQEGDDTGAYD